MSNDKVMDKLRKLIAMQKSAHDIGNVEEAAAFADKIQEVLDRHKIGMDEVEWAAREEAEPIDWESVGSNDPDFKYSKRRIAWQWRLGVAIARCNACKCIIKGGRNAGNAMSFVGRTSDRQLCKVLFIYMINLAYDLNEACAKADTGEQRFKYMNALEPWQDFDLSAFRKHMKLFKVAWFVGFSEAVCERLAARVAAMENTAGSAMVHIRKDLLAVKQYLVGKTSHARSVGKDGDSYNDDGYKRGRSTGEAVNLTPHVFHKDASRGTRLLGS